MLISEKFNIYKLYTKNIYDLCRTKQLIRKFENLNSKKYLGFKLHSDNMNILKNIDNSIDVLV